MPKQEDHGRLGTFNVVAAFDREANARQALDFLVGTGIPRSAMRLRRPREGSDGDEIAEQRAEMQDELVESWPALGLLTSAQAKGAFAGTAIFALGGVILGTLGGLVWAFGFQSALSPLARIVLVAFLTGVAGATVGFVAGGGLEPRREAAADPTRMMDDQRTAAERDVLLAVHVEEQVLADRAADGLRRLGAERVDLVDAAGTPLPPQAEHPRPADPDEDWWWRHAGQG
jgi:hypothetical protein